MWGLQDIVSTKDEDSLCVNSSVSDISWFENSYIDTIGYNKFPEENATWNVLNLHGENGIQQKSWTSIFKTENDTVINNNNYVNIYMYRLNPFFCKINNYSFPPTFRLDPYCSVRQNLIKKQLYIIRHYMNETNEKLLMDFKAKIGDTLYLDAYSLSQINKMSEEYFILDSLNSVKLFNNEERNIQYLSNHDPSLPINLRITEGIGSLDNPFGPIEQESSGNNTISEFCCPQYLLCHSQNHESVYILIHESDCSALKVWASIGENITNGIALFPNPVYSKLNITLSEDISDVKSFEIYNLTVKLILKISPNMTEYQYSIDCSDFKTGIYFIKIDAEQQTFISKFVVAKH